MIQTQLNNANQDVLHLITHYNYGSKICVRSCEAEKFTDSSGIICYDSCKEIPDGLHIYEAADTNVCYTKAELEATFPPTDCSFYYERLDGTWKCIESTSSCHSSGYDYFLGKECKKNCDNYYILMDESGVDTKECFETLNAAKSSTKNINNFHTTLKQCWITYPSSFL